MSVCAVAAARILAHMLFPKALPGERTRFCGHQCNMHGWWRMLHTSIKSNVTNDNPTGDSSAGTFGNGDGRYSLACMQNEFDLKLMGGAYKWRKFSFLRRPKTPLNISGDTGSYVTRIAKYFTKRFGATTARGDQQTSRHHYIASWNTEALVHISFQCCRRQMYA